MLVLGKAVVSTEMVCASHASLAGPALLPVGKVFPPPTPKSKLFWLGSLAWCLIYLQICYSVGSEPKAGRVFASHAESAILPPSHLAFSLRVLTKYGGGRKEGILLTGAESSQQL